MRLIVNGCILLFTRRNAFKSVSYTHLDVYKRQVLQLSGGQQQRVAIARALASEAPVILADEPTGNLDEETAMSIMQILEDSVHQMNKCAVIVTHSNEIAKKADVVFQLKRGTLHIVKNNEKV